MSEASKAEARDLNGIIATRRIEIEKLLPKNTNVDRFIMGARLAIQKNPGLKECDPWSVWAALLRAAELNLDVSGTLQQAALVPYKGECTFQPMYRGLAELARRSGLIESIKARVVYSKEPFTWDDGAVTRLEHQPLSPSMRGDPIAAYAVAIHATGHAQCDVMWKEEIEKIMDRVKARAKNWEKSPWVSDPDEMWKKTAVKRLCKLLPQSQELARAIEYDNEVEGVIDHTPAPEPSAIDKAKARLRATSATLDTEIPTAAEQEEIAKAEAKS